MEELIDESIVLAPLGTKILIPKDLKEKSVLSYIGNIKLELYCSECKKQRVFTGYRLNKVGYHVERNEKTKDVINGYAKGELIILKFKCEFEHVLNIIFEVTNELELTKIGQSIECLKLNIKTNHDLMKELNDIQKEYYYKALKAKDNNLHIAAFLYLRRIFEDQISDANKRAKLKLNGMKTKEQIAVLVDSGELNPLLKEPGYNVLYSLISDGVHNLAEEECEKQFDLLKDAIETILEEEISKKKIEKRKQKISKELNNTNSTKASEKNK